MLNNFLFLASFIFFVNSLNSYSNNNFNIFSIVNTTYTLIIIILLMLSLQGNLNLIWLFVVLLFIGSLEVYLYILSI